MRRPPGGWPSFALGRYVARLVRLPAKSGPATSISPTGSAFSPRITASMSSSTSVALGPTDFNLRDTTHFGWLRHAAAKSCSSAPQRLS